MKKESKLETLKWEIEWNWNNYIASPIRNTIKSIKNLWVWKSVIWNDRFYDYTYINDILSLKLRTMHKEWGNAHYVGSGVDQKEIKKLIDILDRIEYIETEMPDNMTWQEQAEEIQNLYEEFGNTLYKVREFKRPGDTKDVTVKTNLIQLLWD